MAASPVDIHYIAKRYDRLSEINEVVGIWEVHISECQVKLKIKVLKTTLDTAPYMGIADHYIQNPEQGDRYISIHNCETPQAALEDSIKGFLTFFRPELDEKTKYEPVENW